MKKTRKQIFAAAALILAVCMALQGCGKKGSDKQEVEVKSTQTADKLEHGSGEDGSSVTNTGTAAPQVELVGGKKPSYSTGKWDAVNPLDFEYDLNVTTHNVGHFYYGTTNLDVYGAQVNVHPGILPEYVLNADKDWHNAMAEMDSDIYALQEWDEIYLIDSQKNLTITAQETFADVYKQLEVGKWTTNDGRLSISSALAVGAGSDYALTDISFGYLGAKNSDFRRGYVKGYVTVNGIKVAVYSCHLVPGTEEETQAIRRDQCRELAELMRQDGYAVAMGDMNCNDIAEIMLEQGFHVANMGEFGAFNTYFYSEEGSNIDNIITTPNIDILYAECTPGIKGGSDHYPVTAYLNVTDDGDSAVKNPPQAGADGFVEGWYKP